MILDVLHNILHIESSPLFVMCEEVASPIRCNSMRHLFPHRLSAMAIVISSSNRASSKKSLSSVPCGLVSNGLHAKTPSLPSVSMLPEMSRSLKCKILVLVLLFIADTICVMESVLMCAPESVIEVSLVVFAKMTLHNGTTAFLARIQFVIVR